MQPPVIVAEIGASHCGSLERAQALVQAAREAGVTHVKFQTWDVMSVDRTPIQSGPWAGKSPAELYQECKLPWEWHERLFEQCRALKLTPFSTPFDEQSVAFLETLKCPIYKIASFEITHLELIRCAAATGKPIILSTGMASEAEIEAAVAAASAAGAAGVTLLKCVSAYPANPEDYNLEGMLDMAERFGCDVGLSDHTIGNSIAIAATVMGASLIEKHINLPDRKGPDGAFASSPKALGRLVHGVRNAALALGKPVRYGATVGESESRQFRRGIWITKDTPAGAELTRDNTAILRPAAEFAPSAYPDLLGRSVTRACAAGTPVRAEILL